MIERLDLPGLWTWTPHRFEDSRGWLAETYNQRVLEPALGDLRFVQDNHCYSKERAVVRGLHFQIPPMAQDKLVHVARGSILDVALDIRRNSRTYRRHTSIVLSAKTGTQIFIPKGFAHGYVTLEPNTEVIYKVSDYYSADHAKGIFWRDPSFDIDWGIRDGDAIVSEKDLHLPMLADIPNYFE